MARASSRGSLRNSRMKPNLLDSALVLLGHGTTLNADSSAPVRQHAAELRRRNLFAEVREAFWKQEPQAQAVLTSLQSLRIFLVPFFISEGYFSEQAIPKALGFETGQCPHSRLLHRGAQSWIYCKPVGTHESITRVLLDRASDVVKQFPFPRAPEPKDITLFIAGHGTEQNDNSRKSIDHQAELIRAQKLYAGVHSVFLEEPPRIPECYQMAPTRNIVMVPFFTSDGLHVREDIPVLLGEPKGIVQQRLHAGQPTWRNPTGRNGKFVWCASSVGTAPGMAEVILERVREAAAAHV